MQHNPKLAFRIPKLENWCINLHKILLCESNARWNVASFKGCTASYIIHFPIKRHFQIFMLVLLFFYVKCCFPLIGPILENNSCEILQRKTFAERARTLMCWGGSGTNLYWMQKWSSECCRRRSILFFCTSDEKQFLQKRPRGTEPHWFFGNKNEVDP